MKQYSKPEQSKYNIASEKIPPFTLCTNARFFLESCVATLSLEDGQFIHIDLIQQEQYL